LSPLAVPAASRGAITRSAAFALAALLAASALGYWGVGAYRKAQLQRTIVALVLDSSERLERALALEGEAATASSPQTVSKLDDQAQEVDKHVIDLRDLGSSTNSALVAAADDYLLTARQILRELAASHRYRVQVSVSDERLREHMSKAGRRSAAWMDEAIRAKDRLEKNYFDYRVSAEALDRQLASYPETRKKMAAQLRVPILADEPAEIARKRALANSKRIAANVEQARQLAAVH
jgi:DNA-binding transcriptional regulator of glucitol operon